MIITQNIYMTKATFLQNLFRLVFLLVLLSALLLNGQTVLAQECPANYTCRGGCTAAGECVGGVRCELHRDGDVWDLAPGTRACGGGIGEAMLGGIEKPAGLKTYSLVNGSYASIGIVNFASLLLRIFTIICGLWFMFNVIFGGILFVSSSTDTATFGKVKDSLYYSLIGLFLLAIAYMVAGVIGTIFFGDAGFILNPTLTQAGTTP